MDSVKLEIRCVEKSFPGVKALNDVSLSVEAGSVHVLCGENGAGKSTLMKIIAGLCPPDRGEIFIDGKTVEMESPVQARSLGVAMISQELAYVPELSVEESLFMGVLPTTRLGRVAWKQIRKKVLALLQAEGLPYSPETQLKELSISEIQQLEILKAISYQSNIIIMDEPTSAICQRDVDHLFDKISELKKRGVCILYISHKMEEIFRIADQITVLRDGSVVATKPKEEWTMSSIVSAMVGREITMTYPKKDTPHGEKFLEVKNLTSSLFQGISFEVHKGEIVGFAGLVGAGRTEIMRTLFGLDGYQSGSVVMGGEEISIKSVKDSINRGMVMLSEDRRRFGIVPLRSVRENVTLASLKKFIYRGRLHKKDEIETVVRLCERMGIKTPTHDTAMESLSGGNQQKVILAKWLLTDPCLFILDEPTRGIDVGAKFEIYHLMNDLVKQGRCLIMVSSELPELMGMCDRIYVMSEGQITGVLPREEFSQETIMRMAMNVRSEALRNEDDAS